LNENTIAAAEAADGSAQPAPSPEAVTAAAAPEVPPAEAPAPAAEAERPAEDAAPEDATPDDAPYDDDDDEMHEYSEEDEPEPARTTFADLGLSDELLRAVSESGYIHPTPIQEKAIPW
jgi:hypothetical protein